jgi:signal transduction histidine kinase
VEEGFGQATCDVNIIGSIKDGSSTPGRPGYVERLTQLVQHSFATGEPWEDPFPLRRKDGTYRWFLTRALPIRGADGEISGSLGTNTDVTDQKNAEAERERLLALEHEARTKAEHATKARDELLTIVAHDLRNPIQIIMSAAGRIPPLLRMRKAALAAPAT